MRSGVILAGGRAERFGAYKPLVAWRGRPLVAWVADALRPRVDELLVACGSAENAAPLAAALPDARMVADEAQGPLGGLVAAAHAAHGEWLLVAPADSPLLSPRVYDALLDAARDADGAVFVHEGHVQALVAAYRREALLAAAEGARSAREAAARLEAVRLDAGALAPLLRDVDAPHDLDALGASSEP